MKTELPELPRLPSSLLKLALDDLVVMEKSSEYQIRLNNWWHDTPSSGKTVICFAGCIMANTLKLKREPNKNVMPSFYPTRYGHKLRALNYFRLGKILQGLEYLSDKKEFSKIWLNLGKSKELKITSYDENKEQFKSDIQQLIAELRNSGL